MKKLIANLKYLMTARLEDDIEGLYASVYGVEGEVDVLHTRTKQTIDSFRTHREWAQAEIGSIAESIAETRLPLHSSKVCIPCPDILEQGDWVTPAYFCNTCGIANGVEVAQLAYTTWKSTHFDKEPTRSRHNEAYPVYPVGFLRDLINGRYDDIITK